MNQTLTKLPKPIAEGRTAEVYAWNDGKVLKLYHTWCPSHWVEHEARVARKICAAGIPTPAAGEIIEVEGRRGLIYERVDGVSMLADMNAHPWMLLKHARDLAALQAQLHDLSVSEPPIQKEGLGYSIKHARFLPDDLREKALERLETLPDGQNVCHGDFHPGNVLLTNRGPVIIDWMTANIGNPWADVARTSMLLTIGPKAAGKMLNPLLKLAIGLYHQTYLNHYLHLRPDTEGQMERWMPVILAARFNEEIAPEREALLEMTRKYLQNDAQ